MGHCPLDASPRGSGPCIPKYLSGPCEGLEGVLGGGGQQWTEQSSPPSSVCCQQTGKQTHVYHPWIKGLRKKKEGRGDQGSALSSQGLGREQASGGFQEQRVTGGKQSHGRVLNRGVA